MYKFKYYCCPICGKRLFSGMTKCTRCENYIQPYESLHNAEYYLNKSMELFGNQDHAIEILVGEEVSHNPLYNSNITGKLGRATFNPPKEEKNVPKCPTCGSTNIKKISATSKVFGAAMFGLFSRTAHSQFECQDCHYKW